MRVCSQCCCQGAWMRVDKSNADDLSKQRPSSKFATALHSLLKHRSSTLLLNVSCLFGLRWFYRFLQKTYPLHVGAQIVFCHLAVPCSACTQEKPFPTHPIPRHFEAIVLPIVGLYCWGGLPYASDQVLVASFCSAGWQRSFSCNSI